MRIPVQHQPLHHLRIVFRHGFTTIIGLRCGLVGQRRNAHALPGLQTGRGLYPAPIDADFALAAQLLDLDLPDMGKLPPEPAIQPLVALIRSDVQGLNTTHRNIPRASHRPRSSPKIEHTTEATTYRTAPLRSPRS